ncbi:class I SAM-dependent methyltransferase [bacterium]|nr:class I SAM-dependent methyltransferase [bacterium]
MNDMKNRLCPVERAGSLDTKIRRWFQNPLKILGPYIREGMTVLDFGCGPGYFTIDMAEMVGKTGRVIAADLQEGMLQKLKDKIHGTEIDECITLHKSEVNKIGLTDIIDFTLAFSVIHELPSQEDFFMELVSILKPGGQVLIVEPPFHVSKADFVKIIKKAEDVGFKSDEGPRVILNKTVILKKG